MEGGHKYFKQIGKIDAGFSSWPSRGTSFQSTTIAVAPFNAMKYSSLKFILISKIDNIKLSN